MNEKEMYRRIKDSLEKIGLQGYKAFSKKVRINGTKELAGQDFVELDVVAYKGSEVWDIECKKPCTIEKFCFTLGQVVAYGTLFQNQVLLNDLKKKLKEEIDKIEKIDRINFAIALLTTPKYRFKESIAKTFKAMLEKVNLKVALITICDETEKVTRHW